MCARVPVCAHREDRVGCEGYADRVFLAPRITGHRAHWVRARRRRGRGVGGGGPAAAGRRAGRAGPGAGRRPGRGWPVGDRRLADGALVGRAHPRLRTRLAPLPRVSSTSARPIPRLAPVTSTALSEIPRSGRHLLSGPVCRPASPTQLASPCGEGPRRSPFSFAQVRSSADEPLVHVPRTAQRAGGGRTPSLGGLIGDRLRLHVRDQIS